MDIRLEGTWLVRPDRKRIGVSKNYFLDDFSEDLFPKQAALPGSLEESGIGDLVTEASTADVNQTFTYWGWAWYQKTVDFGDAAGKHVLLSLARVSWESTLWIDGDCIGSVCSLSAPHRYDLTEKNLSGVHRVTLMIDNSNQKTDASPVRDSAVYTDAEGRDVNIHLTTQDNGTSKIPCGGHGVRNYHGVIGEMKITVESDPVTACNVYPDTDREEILVKLESPSEKADSVRFALIFEGKTVSETVLERKESGEYRLPVPDCRMWSEFSPNLYTLSVTLCRGGEALGETSVRFGMRKLSAEGRKLMLNGTPVFLRGTLEGVAYPKTVYMPDDKAFWLRAFRVMREYGLNHMRCHTFCPPEAAFAAADEVGVYLQVELPGTSCPTKDEAPVVHRFLLSELRRILDTYGNHPSFCFLSMGNEQLIGGARDFLERHKALLEEKVRFGQQYDPRHLYTATSHPYTEGRCDDYFVTAICASKAINGIRWGGPDPRACSRFCTERPSLDYEYKEAETIDRPVISHEVGQWAVYPDFREALKYTGVAHPGNYAIIAKSLQAHGLSDYLEAFVKSSGMLSLALYKEEIESALRTEALAGFQLLDIHDYPGQGTSTVGILDVFWDSKGLCTPEEFRGFCGSVVPLFCPPKRVYENNETLTAPVRIANYSPSDVWENLHITAKIGDTVAFDEEFPGICASAGGLTAAAEIAWDLSSLERAAEIVVTAEFGAHVNTWKMWVYPHAALPDTDGITIAEDMDAQTEAVLAAGGDVLLLAGRNVNGVNGSFTSVFWNPFMKHQDGWMGILCDPRQPVFREFPTSYHSDWQWWDIVMRAKAMILDDTDIEPLVRVIDSIKDNRSLALMFEARVGRGRLLVCSAELGKNPDENPASKQLLHSIIGYMKSDDFNPAFSTYSYRIRRILAGEKT